MSKKQRIEKQEQEVQVFKRIVRMVIPVPHTDLNDEFVTSQGLEKSVRSLYEDYVMGVLTAKDLGSGSYDPDDSDEVDPLNTSGLTFEDATAIEDAGRNAAREIKQRARPIADHPRESNKPQEEEKPHEEGATS